MYPSKRFDFNTLNQCADSNFDIKYVICTECNNWLTGEIFLYSDQTYCEICSILQHNDYRRDIALESVLNQFLFPCKYYDCDYILKRSQVDEHTRNCKHRQFDCNFCNMEGISLNEYEDHLKSNHKDKIIDLDKPILEHTLDAATKNEILIACLNQHTFLIHIKRDESKLSVNIAHIETYDDSNINNNFTVGYKNDQLTHKQFTVLSAIRYNSNPNVDIDVPQNGNLLLNISLCGFEKVIQLPECPICNYELKLKVYQCPNGHNVCNGCGKKLNTCAICRDTLSVVNLRYLFPSTLLMSCSNYENGCLKIGNVDDLDEHIKNCLYAPIKCIECQQECLRRNILTHFKEKHTVYRNYVPLLVSIKEVSVPNYHIYYYFKNKLFKVNCKTTRSRVKEKICFTVRLLYNENIEVAARYRYEIHIIHRYHNKSNHVLKGVCQVESDKDASSRIYCKLCPIQFNENNDPCFWFMFGFQDENDNM